MLIRKRNIDKSKLRKKRTLNEEKNVNTEPCKSSNDSVNDISTGENQNDGEHDKLGVNGVQRSRDDDNKDNQEDEEEENVKHVLEKTKFQLKLRERKSGFEVSTDPTLLTPIEMRKRRNHEIALNSTDTDENKKSGTIEQDMGLFIPVKSQFTGTAKTGVEKKMDEFIELGLKERGFGKLAPSNTNSTPDPDDTKDNMTTSTHVNTSSSQETSSSSSSKNANNSLGESTAADISSDEENDDILLKPQPINKDFVVPDDPAPIHATGIMEVDLPVEYKIRNIEETEKAKLKEEEEKRKKGHQRHRADHMPKSLSHSFSNRSRFSANSSKTMIDMLSEKEFSQGNNRKSFTYTNIAAETSETSDRSNANSRTNFNDSRNEKKRTSDHYKKSNDEIAYERFVKRFKHRM